MTYLLDANVFIQAKNMHYGFEFCPGFWDWLDQSNRSGLVFSVDKVAEELGKGNDSLKPWVTDRKDSFFLKSDHGVLKQFPIISEWIVKKEYEDFARMAFLATADFYLIAHGLASRFTVVTHERAANSTKKIKIPDVCKGLGVSVMDPFEMLKREQARFVLANHA